MRRELWWLLLASLILRSGVLWFNGAELNHDRDAYLEIGRHLAAGDGFQMGHPPHDTAYRPPLYPLLVAAVFAAGGNVWMLGAVQVLLGTATVALVYRTAGRLSNRTPPSVLTTDHHALATLAALFVAVDPLLLHSTILPMTETLCAFLVALLLALTTDRPSSFHPPSSILPDEPSVARSALIGIVYGLLCLCRPAFLLCAPLAVAGWCLWRSCRPEPKPMLATMLGCLLVLAPWTIRNGKVLGRFTPATTHGGYTLLLANNPVFYREVVAKDWSAVWPEESLRAWQADMEREMSAADPPIGGEVARDRWMQAHAWETIRREPRLFLMACAYRIVSFWGLAPRGAQQATLPRMVVWAVAIFYLGIHVAALVGLVSIVGQVLHFPRPKWAGIPNPAGEREFPAVTDSSPPMGRLQTCPTGWAAAVALLAGVQFAHVVYWTDLRMRAPVIPVIAMLAARGIVSLRQKPALPTTSV